MTPKNSSHPNLHRRHRTLPDTGLFVGYVPGFPGAHSQDQSLEELQENLSEVIAMLLEDGEPDLESEFIGTQKVEVV